MHILNTFGALKHVQSIIEIDHMINRDDGKICTLHVPRSSYTFAFHITSFKILVTTNAHLNISSLAIQHNLCRIGLQ